MFLFEVLYGFFMGFLSVRFKYTCNQIILRGDRKMVVLSVSFINKHPQLKNLLDPFLIEGAEEISVQMSDGHSWNAWVTVYDEHGKMLLSTFETGLYCDLMEVLASIRGYKTLAKRQLKVINKMWQKGTGMM